MKIDAEWVGIITVIIFAIFFILGIAYFCIQGDRSANNSYIHLCLKYNSGYTKEDCEARAILYYPVIDVIRR